MIKNIAEGVVVCPAAEVCTYKGCKAEIVAVSVGEACTKLAVVCEQNFGVTRVSEVGEVYDGVELARDYATGDEVADYLVRMDAPVCNSVGPDEINNPNILFNGKPVI